MTLSRLALLAALVLSPCAHAQRIEPDILFSNFDPYPQINTFGDAALDFPQGGGEYASNALTALINPGGDNDFAGFEVVANPVDASAAESLVFLVRSTVTSSNTSGGRDIVVLEVKLKQNNTEYVALRELAPATGYQFVSIPLSAFRNAGAGLDASAVSSVIYALGGMTGPDFTIEIENLGFSTSPVAVANDFDDGDFGNESFYSFSQTGAGIGGAETAGADGTRAALVIEYDGSATGDFAGFGFTAPGGATVDASGTAFLEFFYRDEDDGTVLLIKLEDTSGAELITSVPLPAGPGFQRLAVPLSSFSGSASLSQIQVLRFELLDRGAGPSSLALDQVTFRARRLPATQTITDGAGWRLLSAPVAGVTVGDLASQNLVQGVAGSFPAAGPNVYTSYTGDPATSGYTPAASTSDALAPGAGFYWYLYDGAGPAIPESRPTPFTLFGQGDAANTDVVVSQTLNVGSEPSSFHMIGNPFDAPFALSGLSETTSGGTLQTSVSVWDASGDTYRMLTLEDQVAVWQGLFAEVTGATSDPTFVFDAASRVDPSAPPFYGRSGASALAFELRGEIDGTAVLDQAAVVRFVEDATAVWDRHDASKLPPLSGTHALVAFEGAGPDGNARHQSVLSLPPEGATETPVAVTATAGGAFTLSWSGGLPDGVTAELVDAATGTVYDLSVPGSAAVSAEAGTWTSPFSVRTSSGVAAAPAAETEERLGAPAPNPSPGVVQLAVQLAAPQTLRVVTYDLLGRQVAASEALQPAGASVLRTDLSGLAAGVYVIRVSGDTLSATRRVTVTR